MPIVLALSTPGAALIAGTSNVTLPQAVGAFQCAGLLTILTGAVRPPVRTVSAIPPAIAGAMLSGVPLPFCRKLLGVVQALPVTVLPAIRVFEVKRLVNPGFAVLAALGTAVALAMTVAGSLPLLCVGMLLAGHSLPSTATGPRSGNFGRGERRTSHDAVSRLSDQNGTSSASTAATMNRATIFFTPALSKSTSSLSPSIPMTAP